MNKIDLYWDDKEVLSDRIRPDVEFLPNRMNRATLEVVVQRRRGRKSRICQDFSQGNGAAIRLCST